MFRHTLRTVVVAVVATVAALVPAASASAAWQTFNTHGTVGPFSDRPHLACTRYGNQLQITVSDPDVGGRWGPVYRDPDGSYTTDWGTGGPQEWVYYQATIYRATPSGGWNLVAQGPWWKTYTGPWKPNVFTTSSWYNVTLGKWDSQIEIPDGTGAVHILFGGPSIFPNLPGAGPRYAVVLEYVLGAHLLLPRGVGLQLGVERLLSAATGSTARPEGDGPRPSPSGPRVDAAHALASRRTRSRWYAIAPGAVSCAACA